MLQIIFERRAHQNLDGWLLMLLCQKLQQGVWVHRSREGVHHQSGMLYAAVYLQAAH